MTVDDMVYLIEDVIAANIEAAPADLPDEAIGEWVEAHGWPLYHVHGDDPNVVNVFAGPTWLFQCTRAEHREVTRRVSGEGS